MAINSTLTILVLNWFIAISMQMQRYMKSLCPNDHIVQRLLGGNLDLTLKQ